MPTGIVVPHEGVRHLAGPLEASILEIGVEFEFVFHGSTLPLSGLTLHGSGEGLEGRNALESLIGVVPGVGATLTILSRAEEVDELVAAVVEPDVNRGVVGGDVEFITAVAMVGLAGVRILMERRQRTQLDQIEHLTDRRVVGLEGRAGALQIAVVVAVDAVDRAIGVLDADKRASGHAFSCVGWVGSEWVSDADLDRFHGSSIIFRR